MFEQSLELIFLLILVKCNVTCSLDVVEESLESIELLFLLRCNISCKIGF